MGKAGEGKAAGTGGRRGYFRGAKKQFKAPTDGYEDVVFDYSPGASGKNKFVENVKKLSQHIAASGKIRHEAPTAALAVRSIKAPVYSDPTKPTKGEDGRYDDLEKDVYLSEKKEVAKLRATWENNNQIIFNLFLSHCTPEMETKLQGMDSWSTVDLEQDGLGLISLIRDVTHNRDESAQAVLDMVRADKELMLWHQKEHVSLTSYLAEFKAKVEVIKALDGLPGYHPGVIKLICQE